MIITASSVTAAAGSTGDTFYLTLANTGPSAQNIAAFSVGITVPTAITLTGGSEASSGGPYIFTGDSFDVLASFPFTTGTGQMTDASDLSFSGIGNTLASGATVGLGSITFNVAAGASAGPVTITLNSTQSPPCGTPCTSLSDSAGANVPFSVVNGTINVTASASIPEPSTLLLALFVLPVIAFRRRSV
jgi:hypothetical protein